MLPTWPAINYKPQLGSFQQSQLANPGLRTEMNAGTTRQRRKFTMRIAVQKVVIWLKASELATFVTFYETTLGDGTARFTMPVWNGAAFVTRTVALNATDGVSYAPVSTVAQLTAVGMTLQVENL